MLPLIVATAVLSGCERASTDAPPQIAYGRDECAHCGMIISDDRFAAALIVREGEQLRSVLFDDIGDLLEYERAHRDVTSVRRYVHDFETRQWVQAAAATFLRNQEFSTPMGSGFIAFSDSDRARTFQQQQKTPTDLQTATAILSAAVDPERAQGSR